MKRVPTVYGMSLEDAERTLREEGFEPVLYVEPTPTRWQRIKAWIRAWWLSPFTRS